MEPVESKILVLIDLVPLDAVFLLQVNFLLCHCKMKRVGDFFGISSIDIDLFHKANSLRPYGNESLSQSPISQTS